MLFLEEEVRLKRSFQHGSARFFFVSGSFIILVLFFTLLLSSLGFLFKFEIDKWQMPVAIISSSLLTVLYFRYYFSRYILATLLCLTITAVLVFSIYLLAGRYIDLSYDGQSYHQVAVMALNNGWNPFYEPFNTEYGSLSRWISHYSKGPWIYESSLFQLNNNLEQTKIFGLLLAWASFCLVISILIELGFSLLDRLFLSGLLAFSPVVLYQSMSFYVDGQLVSLLLSLCAILGLHFLHRDRRFSWMFFVTIVVLVNIKFTAVVYTIIALSTAVILLLGSNHIHQAKSVVIASLAGLLVGIGLIGFNPYVTNLISQGNPFYPLVGKRAIDVRSINVPENYFDKNSLEIFVHSSFSYSDNVRGVGTQANLKFPFSVQSEEIAEFSETNVKVGGFGPLYGGALILAVFIFLLSFFRASYSIKIDEGLPKLVSRPVRAKDKEFEFIRPVAFIFIVTLISVVINPVASLARYVPQAWALPLIAVFLTHRSQGRIISIVKVLLYVVLLSNSVLIGVSYFQENLISSNKFQSRIEYLKQKSSEKPLRIYFGELGMTTHHKLDTHGIQYVEVEELDTCSIRERLIIGNVAYLCE